MYMCNFGIGMRYAVCPRLTWFLVSYLLSFWSELPHEFLVCCEMHLLMSAWSLSQTLLGTYSATHNHLRGAALHCSMGRKGRDTKEWEKKVGKDGGM